MDDNLCLGGIMILSEPTDDHRVPLQWKGPFKLREFIACESLREDFKKPGVYLHLYVGEEVTKLWYIGKSKSSLSKRQKEHYLFTVGGSYRMPKEHKAMKNGEDWNPDPRENKEMRDVCLDQEQYLDYVKTTFSFAETTEVYLAECSDRLVNDVERNLLYKLKPWGTSRGRKSKPPCQLSIVHNNALTRKSWYRSDVTIWTSDGEGESVCTLPLTIENN